MGDRVEFSALAEDAGELVRARLDRSVAVLLQMLAGHWFDRHEDTIGMELELDLVDPLGRPRLVNDAVLARLHRSDFQYELGRFNLELNLPPRQLSGTVLSELDRELAGILGEVSARVEGLGVRLAPIGTLPTVGAADLTHDGLSDNPRYTVLSQRMLAARRELVRVRINGAEPLSFAADSVAPESAATSLQLHLRVSPRRFADFYNAAQAIAGIQVAVGANSPYLLGHELWQETRIALSEQVLDTRHHSEAARGVTPRVWLGRRWVDGPGELFTTLVRDFAPLLPTLEEEDPDQALAAGCAPRLHELRLHNGTVWRWNRPVYDVQDGWPQLRIENRVLPSGPTVIDMVANAAFYYGLVRTLAEAGRPVWRDLPFDVAEHDLHRAARYGLSATVRWPGGPCPIRELVLDELLPQAAAGLDAWGVDRADRDRYLGVIEARVRCGRTGARWQVEAVRRLEQNRAMARGAALREMTRRYLEHARAGSPVHTWPLP